MCVCVCVCVCLCVCVCVIIDDEVNRVVCTYVCCQRH